MKSILSIAKKMTVTALALGLSVLNLSAVSSAYGGNVPSAPRLAPLPELAVGVTAYEDQGLTQGILQGGSISYSGGAPMNYVKFVIINHGPDIAQNFTYKLVVRNNGIKVYDPPAAQLTLKSGEHKTFVAAINLPYNTNSIEAKALVNIGGFMQESNTANNAAQFSYTAKVVH